MSFGRRTNQSASSRMEAAPTPLSQPTSGIRRKPSALGEIASAVIGNVAVRTLFLVLVSTAIVTGGGAMWSGGFAPPGMRVSTGKMVTGVVTSKSMKTKTVSGKPVDTYLIQLTVPNSIYPETVTVTKARFDQLEPGDKFELK